MNISFRVDASTAMGIGHIMRCRTLASVLKNNGCSVKFIMRAHSGNLANSLSRDGFSVVLLPAPTQGVTRDLYQEWLGVSQHVDAEQTILALNGDVCDWLIVDHYGLDIEWESKLRLHTKKLMVIDDLANRKHDCDVLLDQNYVEDYQDRYRLLVPLNCKMLLGPRFAIMLPEYVKYRNTTPIRTGSPNRVLVFMGGSDNTNITGMVLEALSTDQTKKLEVDVVIGPNFIYRDEVIAQAKARHQTNIHGPRTHLADLMSITDFAIGAGGATTWERICMGLPSLVISIAENQEAACNKLAASEIIQYLGRSKDVNVLTIASAISEAFESHESCRKSAILNQNIVDGLGVNRVKEVLNPTEDSKLTIRRANSKDAFFSYSMENNSNKLLTDQGSIQSSLAAYTEWFDGKSEDFTCHFYILQAGDLPIGQVFFEPAGEETRIAYSLDEFFSDRGLIPKLLQLGMASYQKSRPASLQVLNKSQIIVPQASFIGLKHSDTSQDNTVTRSKYRIVLVSDRESWLNDWLPEMIDIWLQEGHRIVWTHQIDSLPSGDFCFYLSFSKIVPIEVRSRFKHNLVVHESDLPMGKGWSPLTWQILEGRDKIPVTLIEAEDKVDSGVIYAQEWISLQGHELLGELRNLQAKSTINLCRRFVEGYPWVAETGAAQSGEDSFYPKRVPADSLLDFNATLSSQFNLLRVVDEQKYPAFFEYEGERFEVCIRKKVK